jgi:hypothetical protein
MESSQETEDTIEEKNYYGTTVFLFSTLETLNDDSASIEIREDRLKVTNSTIVIIDRNYCKGSQIRAS